MALTYVQQQDALGYTLILSDLRQHCSIFISLHIIGWFSDTAGFLLKCEFCCQCQFDEAHTDYSRLFFLSAFRALLQIRAMRKKLSPLSPSSFNPVITSQTSDSEEHSVRQKTKYTQYETMILPSASKISSVPLLVCRRRSTSPQATRQCLSWRRWTGPSTPPRRPLHLSTPVQATSLECCPRTAASLTRRQPAPCPL